MALVVVLPQSVARIDRSLRFCSMMFLILLHN